ncbi:hypothetical protein Tco_1242905 [Tanacetum coccineum]
MTRSTVKRLSKPLDIRRLRRAALRSHQNEYLAIARRNLFDNDASSSNNTGLNRQPLTRPYMSILTPHPPISKIQSPFQPNKPKELNTPQLVTTWDQLVSRFLDHLFLVGRTLVLRDLILRFKQGDDEPIKSVWICFQDLIKQVPHHGKQKWLLVQIFHDNISQEDRRKLDQLAQFHFHSLTEEEGWIRIEEYVQYQDDMWDDMSPPLNISSISETMQPTYRRRLKRACNQISYLETPTREKQKKDDEDERLLLIFKQIHINMPFLEAMIHMPKGAKVLKDILSHNEKLKKAASSVKLSEECYTIIQRSLPQKEGYPGSFTLPCVIEPLAVQNALDD